MGIISTNSLRTYRIDGSFLVNMDGEWFSYRGMTEQASGDMLVHLRYLDNGKPFDIEVRKEDMGQMYWEA
jgi:hypothetical protein